MLRPLTLFRLLAIFLTLEFLLEPSSAHATPDLLGFVILVGGGAALFILPLLLAAFGKRKIARTALSTDKVTLRWRLLGIAVLEGILVALCLKASPWLVADDRLLGILGRISDTLAIWYFQYTPQSFLVTAIVTIPFCFCVTLIPHIVFLRATDKGPLLSRWKLFRTACLMSIVTPLACTIITLPFLGNFPPLKQLRWARDVGKGEETTGLDESLRRAIIQENTDIVAAILRKKANPNAKFQNGFTPLMMAIEKRNPEIVEKLIANGANVNDRIASGTALNHLAQSAAKNSLYWDTYRIIAEILIRHGADINSRTGSGQTPLIQVCSDGDNVALAKLLIAQGAQIDAQDRKGNDALSQACNTNMIMLLIANGANSGRPIEDRRSVLIQAAQRNCPDAVRFYLQSGFDANATDKDGYTALHFCHKPEMAKPLLDHGADVNAQATNGVTPLMKASCEGYDDLVRLYLEKGADVNIRNTAGLTALTLAKMKGRDKIAEILIRHGAQE
ncbi:ankyrin repeat domain-containing protein [Desulfomonile tiedjei]|uniref:Ankyrin repeat-containing protein n=1 Tax=Desulfomonile tiedjei (strain ATCC 49306 / DSM 6799 / DCB-1) TaxID=706587 RepID=I4C6A3_DESTA|nr:ankyrin repeat domain-containing protein [Desulfomonile tiedjei]AFM25094.1 ankyrin repeat-containing protein [Desulfomonile tiedjei DSM 6799]